MLPSIDVVPGGRRERVLDEVASLEHGDVGVTPVEHVHAHQVAARGPALAGAAAPPLERVVVEVERRARPEPEVGAHDVATLGASGVSAPATLRSRGGGGTGAVRARGLAHDRRGGGAGASPERQHRSRRPRAAPVVVGAGAGRVSPIFGLGDGGPPARPRACGPGSSSPASSRATSATSSVVRPRSAAASV